MNAATEPPRGCYSRGYLPHLDTPGLVQSVGIRLAGSLPHAVLDQLYAETRFCWRLAPSIRRFG